MPPTIETVTVCFTCYINCFTSSETFDADEIIGAERPCVNGVRLTTLEKKSSSNCIDTLTNSTRIVATTACPCTRADFVCADGFAANDDQCVATSDLIAQQCANSATYVESSGYRRRNTTQCVGGLQLASEQTRACPIATTALHITLPSIDTGKLTSVI